MNENQKKNKLEQIKYELGGIVKYQVFWKDGAEAYCAEGTNRLWLGGHHVSLAIYDSRRNALSAIKRTIKETKKTIKSLFLKDFKIVSIHIVSCREERL